ncbi:hypothetical protein JTB14_019536 [Gonioctena quinquepunctata]|nr:hypothetical protein JTB14_019536 [Gonioctena quinquepunctata]
MKTNPNMEEFYKTQKKDQKILVRKSRSLYYQNEIYSSGNVNKNTWSVVDELSGKATKKSNITIDSKDGIVEDPLDIENTSNHFFVNAPHDIVDKIHETTNNALRSYLFPSIDTSMFIT